jgi:hypothetical protein
MRENDDDAPGQGSDGRSLADGLGETADPGEYSSTSDPYGDIDDSYDDDPYGDDSYDVDTTDTTSDDTTSDDGTYGDGETGDDEVVIFDDTGDTDRVGDGGSDTDGTGLDDSDLVAQDASPLEGIGFVLEELHDALFGDEDAAASLIEADEAASSALDQDPADLASDTDLDLTGDGLVDGADLHEARSLFDFEPGKGHEV